MNHTMIKRWIIQIKLHWELHKWRELRREQENFSSEYFAVIERTMRLRIFKLLKNDIGICFDSTKWAARYAMKY